MKTKTLKQTGISISGEAYLNMWGGGQGTITMDTIFLPNDKISPKNILRCVNDAGFGCESIFMAEIDIYIQYEEGHREFDRTIIAEHGQHTKFFSGWAALREQGIKL